MIGLWPPDYKNLGFGQYSHPLSVLVEYKEKYIKTFCGDFQVHEEFWDTLVYFLTAKFHSFLGRQNFDTKFRHFINLKFNPKVP